MVAVRDDRRVDVLLDERLGALEEFAGEDDRRGRPVAASWSWVFATSTSIFAAGCSTSISFRIVTPSFVT